MAITATDIKKLRDMTGAGMMKAIEALESAGGDMDMPSSTCAKKVKPQPLRRVTAKPAPDLSKPTFTAAASRPWSRLTARPTLSP